MKVFDSSGSTSQIVQQYKINSKSAAVSGKETAGTGGTAEEKVSLSSKAKGIQQAADIVNALPDIREDKIQELKKQIADGTYQIDAGEIAGKMLEEALMDI